MGGAPRAPLNIRSRESVSLRLNRAAAQFSENANYISGVGETELWGAN